MRRTIAGVALIFTIGSVSMGAQWPKRQAPGVPRDAQGNVRMNAPAPRTPDGKPDLTAPTPRRPDGKPDLSGVWMGVTKYMINIAADRKEDVPFQPWAAAGTSAGIAQVRMTRALAACL